MLQRSRPVFVWPPRRRSNFSASVNCLFWHYKQTPPDARVETLWVDLEPKSTSPLGSCHYWLPESTHRDKVCWQLYLGSCLVLSWIFPFPMKAPNPQVISATVDTCEWRENLRDFKLSPYFGINCSRQRLRLSIAFKTGGFPLPLSERKGPAYTLNNSIVDLLTRRWLSGYRLTKVWLEAKSIHCKRQAPVSVDVVMAEDLLYGAYVLPEHLDPCFMKFTFQSLHRRRIWHGHAYHGHISRSNSCCLHCRSLSRCFDCGSPVSFA